MSVITPPRAPATATGGGAPDGKGPRRRRWILAALGALGASGLAAGLLVATAGTGPQTRPPTTVPTTTVPTTTVPPVPTTTPPAPTATELARAVYPTPSSGIRFSRPVAAARAFAVEFVGFVDPVVSPFRASDAASGTVTLRPTPTGAATTVVVHRVGGSWWVLGCSTPNIEVQQPAALEEIASPVRLEGTSTAFEATVNVEVREDGRRAPIGAGYVMGGSMGQMGPFDGSMSFRTPTAARGALVFYTVSMENGDIWEATVVRVTFGPASAAPSTAA